MKGLLWPVLFVAGLVAASLPLATAYVSDQLPPLETAADLEKALKVTIEAERKAGREDLAAKLSAQDYVAPRFEALPKDLVALYLSQRGCPTYFETPKEEGLRWKWRIVAGLVFGIHFRGPPTCERVFAQRLAEEAGAATAFQKALATYRIHRALGKEQLLAFHLSSLYFDRGVMGVDDAARTLFGKGLAKLSLAELAELILTLPPHELYEEIRLCKNVVMIQRGRNQMLRTLAQDGLISENRVRQAQSQAVACGRP